MNKIALITGASSGIGQATARKLAKSGFDLIICGRRQERLETLKEELLAQVKVTTLNFDVRDRQAVEGAIACLSQEWKPIDVLINCAGNAHGLGTLANGDVDDWEAMIDGNVKGLLYVSKRIIPGMIERQSGHIVNISSVAGKQTYANGVVYCASKHGVEAISEGMRLELTEHGIKVTNVCPGAVNTEFSEVRFKGDKAKADKVYEGFDALQADDIADVIAYAINAPARMTLADVTIYAGAQAAPTLIYKK